MSDLQDQIDRMAENIARQLKSKIQQKLEALSLFDDESSPKRGRPGRKPGRKPGRNAEPKPGPKAVDARAIEDLDEVDQKILALLESEPMPVQVLAKRVKVAVSAVYKRIGRLKAERRLKLVKEGNHVLYTLAPRRGPKKKVKAKRARATAEKN